MKKEIIAIAMAAALTTSIGLSGCSQESGSKESTPQKQAEEMTEPDEKTQAVIDAIDAIGEVNADSGQTIKDARMAYGSLDSKRKKLVSNYEVLEQAEASYAEYEAEEKARREAEEEQRKALAIGDIIENEDFRVTLNNAELTTRFTYPNNTSMPDIYIEPTDGATFVFLTFTVEALNSKALAVDTYALADAVATANGNTYKSWSIEHQLSNIGASMRNMYLEANLPETVYLFTAIPSSATSGPVTVDLKIAGEQKHLVIQ